MPFKVYHSNRIEALARQCAAAIAQRSTPLNHPLVIIPNPYLKKWLQLELARLNGIAMGIDFMTIDEALWKLLESVNQSSTPAPLEYPDLVILTALALRDTVRSNPRLKPIAEYLKRPGGNEDEDYEKKLFQLSSRLARLFLEYELHRPDMILRWTKNEYMHGTLMEAAQQCLYAEIFMKDGIRDRSCPHRMTLFECFMRCLPDMNRISIPEIILFGITHLAPFHLRFLYECASHVDVIIFQLNPCKEYWWDVTTPREDLRRQIQSFNLFSREDSGYDYGTEDQTDENLLLKQWGKQGQESFNLLSMLEDACSGDIAFEQEWIESAASSRTQSCLTVVQDQILNHSSSLGGSISQDASIQIAAAPDIYREAEAVFNSILHNLESDPSLNTTDISVMVPDMDRYGPVLQSVFSRPPQRVAFSMIDCSAMRESHYANGVSALLDLLAGSFNRNDVFTLASNRCFLAAWDLALTDVSIWLAWAKQLNLYYASKNDIGYCDERDHRTWDDGLLRIRFGRIMDASAVSIPEGMFLDFKGIVPYADRYTADTDKVDALLCSFEILLRTGRSLRTRSADGREWAHVIRRMVDRFLDIPADIPEEETVRQTLYETLARLAVFELSSEQKHYHLPFEFIRNYLKENLAAGGYSRGSYLSSGVNISALVPKRQIPFRIIYLMGMQEGLFPGSADQSSLNLMNNKRQIGDPSRPSINRYLFLETILSAREKIYITYVAKDPVKAREYYPNSVTGQLITYLNNFVINHDFQIIEIPASGASVSYCTADSVKPYADMVATRRNGRMLPANYSTRDRLCLLANAIRNHIASPEAAGEIQALLDSSRPDFSINAPETSQERRALAISINDLATFLMDPAKAYLRRHLGIGEDEYDDGRDEEDPPLFSPKYYVFQLINDSITYILRGHTLPEADEYLAAYHRHAALTGNAPTGTYAPIDKNAVRAALRDRLNKPDWKQFIASRMGKDRFQNIIIGESAVNNVPSKRFPAITLDELSTDVNRVVLTGMIPILWRNNKTNEWETIVFVNSDRAESHHCIRPFLFLCIARSGLEPCLHKCFGDKPLRVFAATKKGIASYRYDMSKDEAARYIRQLATDYCDLSSPHLLPLALIEDKKKLTDLVCMDSCPTEEQVEEFSDHLQRLIEEDAQNPYPQYRPPEFLSIAELAVPTDACRIARSRLAPLLAPFVKGGK